MKDILIKTFVLLLGGALLAYVVRLTTQGVQVSVDASDVARYVSLGVCALIALFLLSTQISSAILPNNRRGVLLLGVLMILTAHVYLQDDATSFVYLQDIMKLVGVFLIVAGPTKLLVSEKAQKEIEEQEIEVIEV